MSVVSIVHALGEVFNLEIHLLFIRIVSQLDVDLTSLLLSVVNRVLNKSRAALNEPNFVSDNHLRYVVAHIFLEVVKQVYLD